MGVCVSMKMILRFVSLFIFLENIFVICQNDVVDRIESSSLLSIPRPLFSLHLNQANTNISINYDDNRRKLALSSSARAEYGNSVGNGNNNGDGVINPLYRGFGTHYAFVWVGSPPQRISVIVDTGSHWTAFPCAGCQCGQHMDSYFNPAASISAQIPKCGSNKCYFSQSYSEGSSWKAYKVRDKVWVGGALAEQVSESDSLTVDFVFGCQERETGLFRTQMVDGIMGLSASGDTLPFRLYDAKITKTKAFSMCYRVGGGILNLGGVDPLLNRAPMKYVALTKSSGWFTVRLLKIMMLNKKTGLLTTITERKETLSTGSGCIVDSGTTDTYLPSSIRSQFVATFLKLTDGTVSYSNKQISLTDEQIEKLPSIVFRFEGVNGDPVDIEMPASSYTETLPGQSKQSTSNLKKRNFRVYVTEPRGIVLGANFMNDQNIAFDIQNKRIGFAKSDCEFSKHYSTSSDFESATIKAESDANTIFVDKRQNTKANVGKANTNNAIGVLKLPKPTTGESDPKGALKGHKVTPLIQ
jgi:hypothetical protein